MAVDIYIFALVSAFGFACAAIIRSFFTEIKQLSDIRLPASILKIFVVMLPLTAFSGPYWVMQEAYQATLEGRISLPVGALGALISLIWSFCAGVFVVEFLHLLQLV